MKRHYIYFLLHPVLFYPIYVGQSVAPHLRYRQHLKDEQKYAWWLPPWMFVAGVYSTQDAVDYHENMWVDRLLWWRFPLRNKQLTKPDTPYRPLFWLMPLLRAVWYGKAGFVW